MCVPCIYIYICIYIYVRPSLWNATKHIASERGQTRRFGKWLCSKVMLQTVFQSDPPVTVYIYIMYSWTTAFRRSWCFVGVGWGGVGRGMY